MCGADHKIFAIVNIVVTMFSVLPETILPASLVVVNALTNMLPVLNVDSSSILSISVRKFFLKPEDVPGDFNLEKIDNYLEKHLKLIQSFTILQT